MTDNYLPTLIDEIFKKFYWFQNNNLFMINRYLECN